SSARSSARGPTSRASSPFDSRSEVRMTRTICVLAAAVTAACGGAAQQASKASVAQTSVPPASTGSRIEIADLYHLRSAGDVQCSPDGTRAAFTVINNARPGPPWTEIWMADLASGRAEKWRGADEGSAPRWSRDSSRLAFIGRTDEGKGALIVANADGGGATPIADVIGSNNPLPQVGERFAWSPDGKSIV